MLKMTTYPGMSLGGEVRESISLDEDDLSDVEDEVFIRDGKNSYKLAEELNVKRPLMPPRRKLGKPDITSRLKTRPSCRAFCKPCCYIFVGLSVLIGLIVLVVVLVSIFPLPLDKFRNWIINKSTTKSISDQMKLLPCSNLKITDIWSVNLPLLTTDSPVRILDVNQDSIDDVIFGFGTGDNYNILPPNLFCSIFLGVPSPCQGGVIALNGINGQIEWRYWANDTIFNLHCNEDLNGDNLQDCLAVGVAGTITAINTKNGTILWQNNNHKMDVFVANFIPDQNNDSIADILSSHTNLQENEGHLVLICGRTGKELQRIRLPNQAKTFYMPQLFSNNNNNNTMVLFGTGSPVSPGSLNVALLDAIVKGNLTNQPIYVDHFKGVFTQSILVDLTGDQINDIITAMYNSTIVAIDGKNFKQIWNFTVANSETNIVPIPGYFNYDNITDFLIIYQKYDNILKYNYSNTFIIDGKTGRSIYENPIPGSVLTQMGGLTLSMESYGYDMFVFWTAECENVEILKNNQIVAKGDGCRQFNATNIVKLNALNQCDQPPGFEIYSSVNRTNEFTNTKIPMKQIKDYIVKHYVIPEQGQAEIDETYGDNSQKVHIHKYGSSNFRHKDNQQGIVKDYMNNNENSARINEELDPKYLPNYDWSNSPQNLDNALPGDIDNEFNNYEDGDNSNLFNRKLFDEINGKNTRDPRSKIETNQFINNDDSVEETPETITSPPPSTTTTTKFGIYDYQNVKMARNRLLHDLNNRPNEILLDTFLKNRENQLRKSRFEQRDINSHIDHIKEKEEIKRMLEEEKKRVLNTSFTLWDLESEKELQDRQKDNWRSKREINSTLLGIRKITSVGALLKPFNQTNNSIDIVFVTYWQPPRLGRDEFSEMQITDCVEEKLSNFAKDKDSYSKTTEMEQKSLFAHECLNEQNNLHNEYPYLNDLYQLSLGQMIVYRLRIECECNALNNHERCAKFLPYEQQSWSSYLGRYGDGVFFTRN